MRWQRFAGADLFMADRNVCPTSVMARMSPHRMALLVAAMCCAVGSGCAALPDKIVEPQFHNPLPQIHRVAVLPFFNQSAEPTVNGEAVAIAYYNELQLIPGFEVMPVGVAKAMLAASIQASGQEPIQGADFQRLARMLNVDAVIVGSITEYSPYYPPRMGLAVNWYAANPGFHPIPPGYGLPWGRAEEEFIPSTLVQEAEFALAREQLQTQTPELPLEDLRVGRVEPAAKTTGAIGRGLAALDRSHTAAEARREPRPPEPRPPGEILAEARRKPRPPVPPPDVTSLA